MSNAKTPPTGISRDFDGNVVPAQAATTDLGEMTFAELMALANDGAIAHISDVEDRTEVDKKDLVNVPFVITAWKYKETGDFGTPWVTMDITTDKGDKHYFSDGSTGIRDQIVKYSEKLGGFRPLFVPKGLVASTYDYTDDKGVTAKATTFYFNSQSK